MKSKRKPIYIILYSVDGHHVSLYLNSILDTIDFSVYLPIIAIPQECSEEFSRRLDSNYKNLVTILWLDQSKSKFTEPSFLSKLFAVKSLNFYLKTYSLIKKLTINDTVLILSADHLIYSAFATFFIPSNRSDAKIIAVLVKPINYFKYKLIYTLFKIHLGKLSVSKLFCPNRIINSLEARSYLRCFDVYSTLDAIRLNDDNLNENYNSERSYPSRILGSKLKILVFGVISERKNIRFLFDYISKSTWAQSKLHITIAGQHSEWFKTFISRCNIPSCIHIIPGFITDKKKKQLFIESDVVWVAYEKSFSGSSGVFYDALNFKRLALSSGHGEIGKLCKEFTQYSIRTDSDIEFEKGLRNLYMNYGNIIQESALPNCVRDDLFANCLNSMIVKSL